MSQSVDVEAALAGDLAKDADWHRLARPMLLIQPVRELIRAIPLLIALVFAGRASGGQPWSLVGVAVVSARGVLQWFTTTYRITDTQLQLRRGLLRRRTLVAQLDRVRTVDVTSDIWQRAFGLSKVEIGTGTTDRRKEAFGIDGVGAGRAKELRAELLHRRAELVDAGAAGVAGAAAEPVEQVETVIARLDPRWVRYGPFTLSGAFTALFVLGLGWRVTSEAHLHPDSIGVIRESSHHLRRVPVWLATIEVALPVIAVVAVLSVCGYVLAFWGFRLSRHSGGTLHVERGLLTTRATSLEEKRLRGAEVSEPLLLRAVGGARCLAIATGLRVGRGAERGGTVLLPPAPAREVRRAASDVVHDAEPWTAELRRHPAVATTRRLTRALGVVALLVLVLAALWADGQVDEWLPAVAALLVVPAVPLALDRARALGHQVIAGRWLVARSGSLVRRRCALSLDGVIGVTWRQSPFQRRAGVVTLVATTAAGRQKYAVPDVDAAYSDGLAGELLPGLLDQFAA